MSEFWYYAESQAEAGGRDPSQHDLNPNRAKAGPRVELSFKWRSWGGPTKAL